MQLMQEEGFGKLVDFLYIPYHFQGGFNFGYGFVNLLTHGDAERCRATFHNFTRWPVAGDGKGCDVNSGDSFQGVEAHVERYRNSPVMHESVPDENRPAIYRDGVRQPFPPPTKLIKKPHVRANKRCKTPAEGSAELAIEDSADPADGAG